MLKGVAFQLGDLNLKGLIECEYYENKMDEKKMSATRKIKTMKHDLICVCEKWQGWKQLTLAEAFRQMDAVG